MGGVVCGSLCSLEPAPFARMRARLSRSYDKVPKCGSTVWLPEAVIGAAVLTEDRHHCVACSAGGASGGAGGGDPARAAALVVRKVRLTCLLSRLPPGFLDPSGYFDPPVYGNFQSGGHGGGGGGSSLPAGPTGTWDVCFLCDKLALTEPDFGAVHGEPVPSKHDAASIFSSLPRCARCARVLMSAWFFCWQGITRVRFRAARTMLVVFCARKLRPPLNTELQGL